ncbi:MAG: ribosome recycling factor [Pyramidobacter sp.]|nr:ribosome recycling factor [Pyramidobacter sp.]
MRRDANDFFKKQEKASEITEDDLKLELDAAQKTTDKFIAKVDEEFKKKEADILAK